MLTRLHTNTSYTSYVVYKVQINQEKQFGALQANELGVAFNMLQCFGDYNIAFKNKKLPKWFLWNNPW